MPLSHDQITRLIGMQKGARPDPKSYLPAEYIEKHLAKFTDGVSRIKAGPPQGTDGPPGGAYVMPKAVVAKMIDLAGGDVAFLEKELGLKSGALGANPVVVDIARPQNLRMPSGNEVGANENWRPGGYTSGGTPEAVIDAAGEGTYTVTPAFQPKP
ncbi:MAG: hypothetical protein KF778_11220 [Rhodocyclaceae bacterium]|nr:hypothetical protein [Rhodocyclaceae bacterium]MBX3668965.1 hypothetical protein [Rhodocyclaceae bacterium]